MYTIQIWESRNGMKSDIDLAMSTVLVTTSKHGTGSACFYVFQTEKPCSNHCCLLSYVHIITMLMDVWFLLL